MLRALACCCALVALAPRPAAAEWHMAPMVGFTFAGDTTIVDAEHGAGKLHGQFGGAVTLLGDGLFGVETIFVYTPGFFQAGGGLVKDSSALGLMGNVVLAAPRRWTEYGLRPFVSGGIGLLRASKTEFDFPVGSNFAGFNVGGGAIGFLSQRVGLRFDFRYYSNLRPTDEGAIALGQAHLRYFTGSVGIVFRRGSTRR
jgi:hypothetical protein